jgi:predicted permease
MMTWLTVLIARIRAFFRVADEDREFTQELDAHLAIAVEDHVRRGLTPDQARRAAHLELGGLTQLREAHRDVRGLPLLDTILQDLRDARRTLRRDPGFTAFALLIIGLGIGASATVFSVINALLLRPLPFRDAARLVWISNGGPDGRAWAMTEPPHYLDLQAQNRSFAELAAYNSDYQSGNVKLTGDGDPERLTAVEVSGNFFPFLGVQPIAGRLFTTEECQPNGPRVVLLSHAFWARHFAADPTVVGRMLTLNERPFTIVGILPATFDFGAVFNPGNRIDLFVPYPITPQTRGGNTVAIVGRLAPGASLDAARADFTALSRQLRQSHPERNPVWPLLEPLDQRVNGRFRPALLLLSWAVGVVMLIVCANLSNLQLARLSSRQQELAIRIALGAGRRRIVQQLLTESLVLSGCGAMLGLAIAAAGTRIVSHLDAFNIPLLGRVQLDAAVCGFVVLIAVITGLIFGLMPALQVPALTVHAALKEHTRGSSDGRKHAWLRGALVVSEIAFACVLLVGAGLLIRSLLRVLDVQLGFRPERVATLRIDPPAVYSNQARRNRYYDDALGRIRASGGINGAAVADMLPLDDDRGWAVSRDDKVYAPRDRSESYIRVVSDGYFKTMGIALQRGRDFTPHDVPASEPVVIVNDVLARTLWPGEDPLAHRIRFGDGGIRRVVGVVAAVRHVVLEGDLTNELYLPIRQTDDYPSVRLIVRTDLTPAALTSTVRTALIPIAPDLPMRDWRTLGDIVDKHVSPRRFVVSLLTSFSAFALVLASLGIYGLISYSVNQRQKEIAIRLALGASAGDVQLRIMRQTLTLAALGLLIGVPASWLLGRTLTSLLFGITASDPVTFAAMFLLLAIVAGVAGYLPSRRASRIDPIMALRAT